MMPPDSFPVAHNEIPDESVIQLLHRVLQVSLDTYHLETGDCEITHRQFVVLRALAITDGISQTQLAQTTGIDRSTLAELVARMVRKKLLRRRRAPGDSRTNLVSLDEAGRAILEDLMPRARLADEKILARMSAAERATFIRLLAHLAEARDAIALPPETEPLADKPAQRGTSKKCRTRFDLDKLPMPPLSEGAIPHVGEDPEASDAPPKWKPPKPLWKVG